MGNEEVCPATPYNDTGVIDQPWDGPANEARLSNDAGRSTYEKVYGWRDPDGDEDAKSSYALPHHEVSSSGQPGSANVRGVRNALARLPQSRIPSSDHDSVRSHLNRHLNKFNRGKESSEIRDEGNALVSLATLVETEGRVWAIRPEVLAGLSNLRSSAHALDEADHLIRQNADQELLELQSKRRTSAQLRSKGDVAVLSLKGVLMPQMSFIAILFGMGSGLVRFREHLSQATQDDDIGAIVLDVDSPGGLVDQIPEVAAEIRSAREVKPVIAVANTLAASAAYWLAAQADEVVVTPSGEVGSIGVYSEHRDISAMLQDVGIKPTLISAGKFKTEGNPYEELGDEARAAIQEGVDYAYGLFVSDVAKGRDDQVSKVKSGYGEGRVLNPRRAMQENLADRIDTLDATIARLQGRSSSTSTSRRSETSNRAERPPNLRDSTGDESCGNCTHFDGEGFCEKFDFNVRSSQVCDSWEAEEESSDEAAQTMGSVFDAFFGKDEKEVVH